MDGVLVVNKAPGPTSHDVVAMVRRAAGQKRVGHAGTLDPDASGVLLVCLGNATRIVEYLMDRHKFYTATAVFGAETSTEDASGDILRETDCSHVDRDAVEAALPKFTGKISQIPPMVSAVHHNGRRLYELARKGQEVERAPRFVEVYSLKLIDFVQGGRAQAVLDVECSRGTYIRTLCADIGRELGCGGYMAALTRTAVGGFDLDDAVSIEAVREKAAEGRLGDILHSIDDVLADMPGVEVSEEDAKRTANGIKLPASELALEATPAVDVPMRILGPDRRLIAVGAFRMRDGELALKPDKVFAQLQDFL